MPVVFFVSGLFKNCISLVSGLSLRVTVISVFPLFLFYLFSVISETTVKQKGRKFFLVINNKK